MTLLRGDYERSTVFLLLRLKLPSRQGLVVLTVGV